VGVSGIAGRVLVRVRLPIPADIWFPPIVEDRNGSDVTTGTSAWSSDRRRRGPGGPFGWEAARMALLFRRPERRPGTVDEVFASDLLVNLVQAETQGEVDDAQFADNRG
jgi:hypothetical protein